MSGTRWTTLLAWLLPAGLFGWLLPDRAYGHLQALPVYAPLSAAALAAFELVLARVVSRKVRHVGPPRPLHPLQVARALVLAKASSVTGALLGGFYGGFLLWTLLRTEVRAARHDAWVAGGSAAAAVLLVVAALLLERACRTPRPRDEMRA